MKNVELFIIIKYWSHVLNSAMHVLPISLFGWANM